eukprot:scaffold172092_cov23-Tisochrysis_lutea.AAC.1
MNMYQRGSWEYIVVICVHGMRVPMLMTNLMRVSSLLDFLLAVRADSAAKSRWNAAKAHLHYAIKECVGLLAAFLTD